jgi:urocanate hydratase
MYRFRPDYEMRARLKNTLGARTGKGYYADEQSRLCRGATSHELITYGGNGAVFQNWAQYLLTMKYLSEMTDERTLTMYSGHPMVVSIIKKHRRVVIQGMVILILNQ